MLRFFHFYPSQQKALAPGRRVRVFGEVRDGHFGREIVHPQFKVVAPGAPLPDRLTPVYPTTAGLVAGDAAQGDRARARRRSGATRRDRCPSGSSRRRHLWKFGDAVQFLHTPPPRLVALTQRALDARTHPAWTRLKFDELLAQQLSLKAHRKARAARHAPVLTGTGALTDALLARVPFKLTRAQERVWREIGHDLKRATPMQRLLQGDVGSGKTIVAALAALQAIESGRQVAFMAPTEILAEQHYRKLAQWLDGTAGRGRVALGRAARRRRGKKALAAIASGEAHVRDRHARAVRGRGRAAAARARDRRRAAPLRRRAAAEAARQGAGRGAPADDERDADPAHAGDDVLRRPRRVGAGRDAAGAHAGRDAARQQQAPRRGDRAGPRGVRERAAGVLGVPADRGVGEARAADGGRAARGADRGAARASRSGCCTAG